MLHAVIMAGGKGERFWPLSRTRTPKQLLEIVGRKTMFEQTVARLKPLVDESRLWVVTNASQATSIRRYLPRAAHSHVIAEPVGRNTAPCVALAAYLIAREDPEGVMVVLPADHVISPAAKFRSAIRACAGVARDRESLITIGIKPGYPATGYGYIKRGRKVLGKGTQTFYRVERFIEKPDRKRARSFIRGPLYSWNSGIFVWSVPTICRALEAHLPEVASKLQPLRTLAVGKRRDFLKKTFPALPSISIDCGVMEKHPDVLVTPAAFDWDDVGSWEALKNHFPKDGSNNLGKGKFVTHDASGCIVFSRRPLVGLVGVSNLIVVATEDAVLVCPREKAQDVRKLVRQLGKKKEHQAYL